VARNRLIAIVAIAIVIVALGAFFLARGGDETSSTTATTEGVVVTSPYDLTEAKAEIDLDIVKDAKFASIMLETSQGLTSYMVAAEEPTFAALAEAVSRADETDDTVPATQSTLAFVMPDRVTVTFVLDVDEGLIEREGRSWRPDGDLTALIAEITSQAPTPTD
jgi:hypothetical protein